MIACASLATVSCDKNESVGEYSNGVFIANEGNMGSNNGSVSFYCYDTDSVYNDIFYAVNNRTAGDVVQSLTLHNDKAYIVVNNSNKVEIVNRNTFKEYGVITDLSSPRHLIVSGNSAYISCWGDNSVKVVDLGTNSIKKTIAVHSGPDKMCIVNDKLYVANSGIFIPDSVVTVIDLISNDIVKEIVVKYSPVDLVADKGNTLWVLCYGKVIYSPEEPYPIIGETPSKLYSIDTDIDVLLSEITLFNTQHPQQLEIGNDGKLYFGGGYTFQGIYSLEIGQGIATATRIISDFAYGFNIDPNTDVLFLTLATSFTAPGLLKRYTSDGSLLGTYECGIGPNSIAF
jgi:YVTN family beta-propeller protein